MRFSYPLRVRRLALSCVFIDAALEDYPMLVRGMLPTAEVRVLDPQRDGIEQVSEVLANRRVFSLQLLAHGSPGSLQLGCSTLNLDTLQTYRPLLEQWQVKDLLLYGCDIAAGAGGQAFLAQLQQLMGANIAAADRKIGQGHWGLDVEIGKISSSLALSKAVVESYGGLLVSSSDQTSLAATYPQAVTTVDFNGDGKTDLATVNLYSDSVSVLLGDGSGGFSVENTFAVGGKPYALTTGDFNGDGKTDLAVATYSSKNVTVLLGDGRGGFSAPTTFADGSLAFSAEREVFNGTGKTDLAALTSNSATSNSFQIMPIGDSLTVGRTGDDIYLQVGEDSSDFTQAAPAGKGDDTWLGYRKYLLDDLLSKNLNVKYIGSQYNPSGSNTYDPNKLYQHQGHRGDTIQSLTDRINGNAQDTQPGPNGPQNPTVQNFRATYPGDKRDPFQNTAPNISWKTDTQNGLFTPDVILLMAGTNNFLVPDDYTIPTNQIGKEFQALTELINSLNNTLGGKEQIFVASILYIDATATGYFTQQQLNTKITVYNDNIEQLADSDPYDNVYFADINQQLFPNNNPTGTYIRSLLPDGFHPKSQVYETIASAWDTPELVSVLTPSSRLTISTNDIRGASDDNVNGHERGSSSNNSPATAIGIQVQSGVVIDTAGGNDGISGSAQVAYPYGKAASGIAKGIFTEGSISGGSGNDTISGAAKGGAEAYGIYTGVVSTVNGGDGNDLITGVGQTNSGGRGDGIYNLGTIVGGFGNDTITGYGTYAGIQGGIVDGGLGDNTFIARRINPDGTIATNQGGAARDALIRGGTGNDIFDVGYGNSTLEGGGGNDTLLLPGSRTDYTVGSSTGYTTYSRDGYTLFVSGIAAGNVRFAVPEVSIAATTQASEPASNGVFTVSLNQAASTNTVVSYTVAGTATAGTDYTALSGSVTIPANQLSATIPVAVLDDQLAEGAESVIVTLTGATGSNAVLGAAKTATVTIADNETQPLTIEAETIPNVTGYLVEPNSVASNGSMLSLVGSTSDTGTATFTFTGATGNYNVILGTFDENDGVATFQVAKDGTSIGSVALNQDRGSPAADAATKVEKTVATGVSIANGQNITVTGKKNGTEYARFDYIRFEPVGPTVPEVSIAATSNAAEPNSNGLFTLSLNQAASTNTVVSYTVAGTATAGTDYTALSGSVTIPANQLSATIPVAVLDDQLAEGAESVIVTLTGATGSNAVLGATKTATVNIADNDPPPLTIEAESIPTSTVSVYRKESNSVASGGSMLSLIGVAASETGTATFTFTGATGNYNVILGTFDENDGVATLQVAKNGTSIGSVVLNQNLGSNSATAATKVEKDVATGVSITNGNTITVTGKENAGEAARFDYIRFVPVGGPLVPQVSITATTNAAEPNSNGLFTVSLNQAATTNTVVSYTVTGTATAGTDYTTLSGTVTIPATQLSATIPVLVLDDNAAEGAESVIVTLTGATGSNAVLGATKTATVNIADNEPTALTLQAETANSIVKYRTEAIGVASGGQVLSFVGGASGESGTAQFVMPDTVTGTYNISIGTFDENDGVASFTVQLKHIDTGTTTQIGSLTLNADFGSPAADAQTFVNPTVATGINLKKGDTLIVNGFENGAEYARLDFIRLIPVI